MALQRNLPLYAEKSLHNDYQPFCKRSFINQAHLGLLFDKYLDTWGRGFVIQEPNNTQQGSKQCFYDEIISHYKAKPQQDEITRRLKAHHERHEALLKALQGEFLTAKTDWRFVSGLGTGHPFGAGFIWHRTLSVPYLPGSSVKGMIRAWADPRLDSAGNPQGWGDPAQWNEIKRLFGDDDSAGAGSLIVFDALPVQAPTLELDIMNPHYAEYYSKKLDGQDNPIPPADYLSPTPVFFMTVAANTEFQFALAPRPKPRCPKDENATTDMQRGLELLGEALKILGCGGKTAVGYGQMTCDPASQPTVPLAEFKAWFKAQKFSAQNKGQHGEIIKRLGTLSDVTAGKQWVKDLMNKKDCTDRLWDFLKN